LPDCLVRMRKWILAEYRNQKGDVETKELVDNVATVLTWALLLTCVIGVLGATGFVYMFASGFKDDPSKFALTIDLTRMMFPYIGFMSLVALSSGILNTWRQFKIPAFTPVLLNLSFIVAALLSGPLLGHDKQIYALGFAVLIGGVLQLALQIPSLIKIGMLPKIRLNPLFALRDPKVLRVLRQMGPAVLAVSATQISIIINSTWASHIPSAMSHLNYADRLMELPSALLGVALGTILLPSLSGAKAKGDIEEYSSLLDWGLRLTCLLALPAAVALLTIPEALVATLYHGGKFDAHAVHMTARAVAAYGVGLTGLILVKILAPGFYAQQDIRTPVKIALLVLLVTQLLNLGFYLFLPNLAEAGLALSVGLGACVNAALLFRGLRQRKLYAPEVGWLRFLFKLSLALVLMGLVGYFLCAQVDWIAMRSRSLLRWGQLLGVIAACMLTYFGALFVMGFRLRDFRKVSHR
jgi:putative peptidoglycan lipid II flippase